MKKLFQIVFLLDLTASLAGCGLGNLSGSGPLPMTGAGISGVVHGGQQPVSGASIKLYAASTSGYGTASTSMLTSPVFSSTSGTFNITSDFTCPSASAQVYLVAVGGNPGLMSGTNNAQLVEMAALGDCGGLSASTLINVNELTTVVSAYALSPFMAGYANVGTSSTNVAGLTNAFAAVNKLVNTSSGLPGGPALPAGATIPIAELNTLANILSSCVNTSGGTTSSTTCGQLFAAAGAVNGIQPSDTAGLALSMARNPTAAVGTLFGYATASPPFQPALSSAPNDWSVAINYTGGGMNNPRGISISSTGNIFVANSGSGSTSISGFSNAGAALNGSPYSGASLSVPYATAVDMADNVWIVSRGNNSLTKLTAGSTPLILSSYTAAQYTGGGLNLPTSLAIDGFGNVWTANAGNNSVSQFTSSGSAVSGSNGFTGSGISAPTAIAINPK